MSANHDYLSYGRWDEYRKATDARLQLLEQGLHELRGSDAEHQALSERIDHLDKEVRGWREREEAAHTEHQTRTWQVALAIVTGLVLPLVSIGIIALIHFVTKS